MKLTKTQTRALISAAQKIESTGASTVNLLGHISGRGVAFESIIEALYLRGVTDREGVLTAEGVALATELRIAARLAAAERTPK